MLTTSQNPDDAAKAKTWSSISDYITKPLTKEMIRNIIGSPKSTIDLEEIMNGKKILLLNLSQGNWVRIMRLF